MQLLEDRQHIFHLCEEVAHGVCTWRSFGRSTGGRFGSRRWRSRFSGSGSFCGRRRGCSRWSCFGGWGCLLLATEEAFEALLELVKSIRSYRVIRSAKWLVQYRRYLLDLRTPGMLIAGRVTIRRSTVIESHKISVLKVVAERAVEGRRGGRGESRSGKGRWLRLSWPEQGCDRLVGAATFGLECRHVMQAPAKTRAGFGGSRHERILRLSPFVRHEQC